MISSLDLHLISIIFYQYKMVLKYQLVVATVMKLHILRLTIGYTTPDRKFHKTEIEERSQYWWTGSSQI